MMTEEQREAKRERDRIYRRRIDALKRQIMAEQKKPERTDITLPGEKLRKYFPRSYTPMQIETT